MYEEYTEEDYNLDNPQESVFMNVLTMVLVAVVVVALGNFYWDVFIQGGLSPEAIAKVIAK